ncbi:Guanine exchange factor for Rac 30 [Pelomyxa schiedti]|nr:Guanine exchange factor for Rac 30 [Pelomyxa schiedti]
MSSAPPLPSRTLSTPNLAALAPRIPSRNANSSSPLHSSTTGTPPQIPLRSSAATTTPNPNTNPTTTTTTTASSPSTTSTTTTGGGPHTPTTTGRPSGRSALTSSAPIMPSRTTPASTPSSPLQPQRQQETKPISAAMPPRPSAPATPPGSSANGSTSSHGSVQPQLPARTAATGNARSSSPTTVTTTPLAADSTAQSNPGSPVLPPRRNATPAAAAPPSLPPRSSGDSCSQPVTEHVHEEVGRQDDEEHPQSTHEDSTSPSPLQEGDDNTAPQTESTPPSSSDSHTSTAHLPHPHPVLRRTTSGGETNSPSAFPRPVAIRHQHSASQQMTPTETDNLREKANSAPPRRAPPPIPPKKPLVASAAKSSMETNTAHTPESSTTTSTSETTTSQESHTQSEAPSSAPPLPRRVPGSVTCRPTLTTSASATSTTSNKCLRGSSATSSTTTTPPLAQDTEASSAAQVSPESPPSSSMSATELSGWVEHLTPEEAGKLPDMLKKRTQVVAEILSTEETYFQQLNAVVQRFVEHLKCVPKGLGLSSEDIFNIFCNLEVIRDCHSRLLAAIGARVAAWDANCLIGDIFRKETAWIKLYKHYINNYGKSLISLKECKDKHPLFKKYLELMNYSPALFGLNLESLLIVPVQRIPRYVLLLTDVLRATPKAHPDYQNLEEALNFIKELADYINENKADADSIAELCEIQTRLLDFPGPGKLASQPKRKFVKEGAALLNKKKKYLFLFSDILVTAKGPDKSGKFKFDQLIHLNTTSVQGGAAHSINIISTDGMQNCTFHTEKDFDEWYKALSLSCQSARDTMIASAFVDTVNSLNEGSRSYTAIVNAENDKKCSAAVVKLGESEAEYVKHIKIVYTLFIQPMKQTADGPAPVIDSTIVNQLYNCWVKLVEEHSRLSCELQKKIASWEPGSTVTDIFDAPKLVAIYTEYVEHYAEQTSRIDKAKESSQSFLLWLLDVEAKNKTDLKLSLERPLKQISSYYLQLQEMMHYTNKKSTHFEVLKNLVLQLGLATEELKRKTTHTTATVEKRKKSKS